MIKKFSDFTQRVVTVDEIKLKIKEISEKREANITSSEAFDAAGRILCDINPFLMETGFYLLARKIGKKLKQCGLYRVVEKVKKLIPYGLKYKNFF